MTRCWPEVRILSEALPHACWCAGSDTPCMEMITTALEDSSTGVWLVRTETSAYRLDLDARLASRLPGDGVTPDSDEVFVAALRKDGLVWSLDELVHCSIGEPMVILAHGISDDPDVSTVRRTTFVQSIEPV